MDLRDYLKFLKRYYRLICAVTFIFIIIGFLYSYLSTTMYRSSTTLIVRREAVDTNPNYFTYEGYYAQQTAQEYADTVVGFLESEDVAMHTLNIAGLTSGTKQVKMLNTLIDVKKTAPNLITLTLDWEDSETSAKLLNALVSSTKKRSQELNDKGDQAIHVDPIATEPIVEKREPRYFLNSLVLGLSGSLLTIFSLSFYLYLTEE